MRPDSHEIYTRRRSRNLGVGLALLAFAALTFGVTLVKVGEDLSRQNSDRTLQSERLPEVEGSL